jgi:hypothetical protein
MLGDLRRTALLAVVAASACAVDVGALRMAAPRPVPGDVRFVSRGRREGEDCRPWVLGVPLGLPQIDRAIDDALAPVAGVLMRDVTVYSVHSVYVLGGKHCYHVAGEVLAPVAR